MLPAWLTLTDHGDGAADLAGTPLNQHVGDNAVTLRVSDALGAVDLQTFTIAVANTSDDPYFTSTAVTDAEEEAGYSYAVTATDDDPGDTVTITAPVLPAWLTLTDHGDGTADLIGTPLNQHVGSHPVTLRVTDALSATADQPFSIEVANTNDDPYFTSTATTGVAEDAPYDCAVTASDDDAGDVLTITAPVLPTWLTLTDHGNGTADLTGTPSYQHVGDHPVTLRVTDTLGAMADQPFTVTVSALPLVDLVVDDGDPGYSEIGAGWQDGADGLAYQGDYRIHALGAGSNQAEWTFTALANGVYTVFATWAPSDPAGTLRATDAPYAVLDDVTALRTVRVNQELAPEGPSASGAVWQELGTFAVASGTLVVRLSDDADDSVVADAIRVLQVRTPAVLDASVNGGAVQRSTIDSLAVTFNEDVTVAQDALTIYNVTADENVILPPAILSYDSIGYVATWDLSGVTLVDGYHVATLSAGGVTDAGGDLLAGGNDYAFTFTRLTGDASGDGFIGQDDLDTVLGAWGSSVTPGDPGDLTGDGFVGQDDLDTVLGNWGQSVAPPPPAAASQTSAAAVQADGSGSTESVETTTTGESTPSRPAGQEGPPGPIGTPRHRGRAEEAVGRRRQTPWRPAGHQSAASPGPVDLLAGSSTLSAGPTAMDGVAGDATILEVRLGASSPAAPRPPARRTTLMPTARPSPRRSTRSPVATPVGFEEPDADLVDLLENLLLPRG